MADTKRLQQWDALADGHVDEEKKGTSLIR